MENRCSAWAFPGFVFAIAALAFVPNAPSFLSAYVGWWICGLLLVAALALSMGFVRSFSVLIVALLAVVVLASPTGLPMATGLPFLGIGWLFASEGRWPESPAWARALGLIVFAWMVWAIFGWYRFGIAPAESSWAFVRFFSPDWPGDVAWPRIGWPTGNANTMAGLLLMLVPLGVAQTVREAKSKLWRTPWAVGTALAALLLVASGSRAGLIAPFLAAGVYVLLLPESRLRLRLKAGFILVGVVSLALIALTSPVYRKLLQNPAAKLYSDETRGDYLRTAARMIEAHPFSGVGAGGVPAHYSAYLSADSDQPACLQLHCTPVHWAAEFGMLGGALWFLLAALTLWALWTLARATKVCALRAGATVAAASYLFFSVLDYQLYLPVTAFVWGACLGAALRGSFVRETPGRVRPMLAILQAGLAGVAGVIVISGAAARGYGREAAAALASGHSDAALVALGRAMAADESSPVYPAVAATVLVTTPSRDEAAASANRRIADALLTKARQSAPDFPYLASLQGWVWVDTDPKRAEAYFIEALRVSPKLTDAWQGLARARAIQGRLDDAVSALALNGMIMPEDLFSPELRRGFFNGAAPRVAARFRQLILSYKVQFPSDVRGAERLDEVLRQLDAWAAAGERVDRFVSQNPAWSGSPVWRHLASVDFRKDESGEYPVRSRLIVSALLHARLGLEPKNRHAIAVLEEAQGKPQPESESNRRTLFSRESFSGLGLYFGDSQLRTAPLRLAQTDLLALEYVYQGNPVRPHVCAAFFRQQIDSMSPVPANAAKP